jgi:hypothetical protein
MAKRLIKLCQSVTVEKKFYNIGKGASVMMKKKFYNIDTGTRVVTEMFLNIVSVAAMMSKKVL